MKHKFVSWVMPTSSLFVATAIVVYSIQTTYREAWDFTWRWFAVPVLVALIAHVLLLLLSIKRSSSNHGSIYWFALLLIANIANVIVVLGQALSATAAASSFWQGILPLTWIGLPVIILFFVISYIDDTNYPLNFTAWTLTLASLAVLIMWAGLTDLIESHTPLNSSLQYWGYQSEPGRYSIIVFAWMSLVAVICLSLLIKAYGRATTTARKNQLRIFILGISQFVAIGIICDIVIYSFNATLLPPMSFFYTTLLSLIFGYGVLKYGLFQISAAGLSGPILHNLSEAVLGLNTKLKIEFANHAATTIFGYKEETFNRMSVRKLFSSLDYEALTNQLKLGHSTYKTEDITILDRHDNKVPVALSISRVLDDNQRLAGYILVVQNITEIKKQSIELAKEKASVERKVTERTRQLHEEQSKLRASIDGLKQGFILVDNQDQLLIQNNAVQTIFGLSTPISSLNDLNAYLGDFDIASHSRSIRDKNVLVKPTEIASGSKILRIYIGPVTDTVHNDKVLIGSIIFIEDITEAKVLERSKDEFFSIASHELRTPLTAIRGNSSMMTQLYADTFKEPALKEMINDIHDSSTRLINIVNDFLDVSSIEQGKIKFVFDEVELDKIIEQVADEMKVILTDKKVQLKIEPKTPWHLPKVIADTNRVKQIIFNLVGNGVKFTEQGGSVTVTATKLTVDSVPMLKVTVTDTGRGIPIDTQKLLFHKFQQAGSSLLTRDTTKGTGLGLYVNKLLIEGMGGEIWLEKSVMNEGSAFVFTLPVATAERLKSLQESEKITTNTKTGLSQPQGNPQS